MSYEKEGERKGGRVKEKADLLASATQTRRFTAKCHYAILVCGCEKLQTLKVDRTKLTRPVKLNHSSRHSRAWALSAQW
jgi:hypothetical protein